MTVAGFGESQYWKGNDRFNRHDYRGAIEAYSKAILKDPTNFAALLHRATSHELLEEYEEALTDYDRAIALVSSFGVAFHYRGHVHSKLGKPDLAVADYDSALIWAHTVAVDPHGIMMKVDRASAYYDRGNAYRHLEPARGTSIASHDSSIMLAQSSPPRTTTVACRERTRATSWPPAAIARRPANSGLPSPVTGCGTAAARGERTRRRDTLRACHQRKPPWSGEHHGGRLLESASGPGDPAPASAAEGRTGAAWSPRRSRCDLR